FTPRTSERMLNAVARLEQQLGIYDLCSLRPKSRAASTGGKIHVPHQVQFKVIYHPSESILIGRVWNSKTTRAACRLTSVEKNLGSELVRLEKQREQRVTRNFSPDRKSHHLDRPFSSFRILNHGPLEPVQSAAVQIHISVRIDNDQVEIVGRIGTPIM